MDTLRVRRTVYVHAQIVLAMIYGILYHFGYYFLGCVAIFTAFFLQYLILLWLALSSNVHEETLQTSAIFGTLCFACTHVDSFSNDGSGPGCIKPSLREFR